MALEVPSDEQLMESIREHDAGAFDLVAARYTDSVTRRIRSIVRDEDAAGDLAQEVFLRVWTHAESWEATGSFRAWLFRIANNIALNYLRTVRRRRERPLSVTTDPCSDEEDSTAMWMEDTSSPRPEEAVVQAERRRLIREMVENLPQDKREAIRLVHEAEMDIRDAAETLGVPMGTVKSRLHYARKRLARDLRQLESEWEEIE